MVLILAAVNLLRPRPCTCIRTARNCSHCEQRGMMGVRCTSWGAVVGSTAAPIAARAAWVVVVVNEQYQGADPFGGTGGYASTGAAGTAVAAVESAGGATIGSWPITPTYGSSQVAWPSVSVQQGDTSGSAVDAPVPVSGDPMTGLSLADITQTGAGQGSAYARNPNAPGVSSMAAQLARAQGRL